MYVASLCQAGSYHDENNPIKNSFLQINSEVRAPGIRHKKLFKIETRSNPYIKAIWS